MNSADDSQTVFFTRTEGLARLLAVDDTAAAVWAPAEMEAMWRHQLAAPIEADLYDNQNLESKSRQSPEMQAFGEKSFHDLLHHPQPPLELLKLAKDFAKQILAHSEDPQLTEVARALYYASYAAALIRWQQPIGRMGNERLERGFEWSLKQPWLDSQTKKLIAAARDTLPKPA